MMDSELSQAERAAMMDDDPTAAIDQLRRRSRAGDVDALLSPLVDRERWNGCAVAVQDMAIREVERRLGGAFDLDRVGVWDCGCDFDVEAGMLKDTLSHRLVTFRHVATGMEMNLVPGQREVTDAELFAKVANEGSPGLEYGQTFSVQGCKQIPPFLIGRWPVTWAQSLALGLTNGMEIHRDHPRTGVPFSSTLKALMHNDGLRLPSSAEWQHACRSGTTTRFYWGDEFDGIHVWFAGNSGDECATCDGSGVFMPVMDHSDLGPGSDDARDCPDCPSHSGTRPRPHSPAEHDKTGKWNAYGLVDMIGNVCEWLTDESVAGLSYSDLADDFRACIDDGIWISHARTSMPQTIGIRAVCSVSAAKT